MKPPARYGGLVGSMREATRRDEAGDVESELFKVKWFQNGNLHFWILDQDIIDKMNAVLAANGEKDTNEE